MTTRITIALVAIAVLTIGPAIITGRYSNRWGVPPDLDGGARRVRALPHEFGNWTFTKEGEALSEDVCQELGLAGNITRVYTNHETGSAISLLLMVGQPGPLLRHPPNICYANRANEQVGDATTFEASTTTPASQFSLLEYKPPTSFANDRFLVAYSMTTAEDWHVPRLPRIEFGGASVLYKVQMLMMLDSSHDREKGMAILQQFANDFCRVVSTTNINEWPCNDERCLTKERFA